MTEDEAEDIYNDESREKQCIEYLIARAVTERKISKEITGSDTDHDVEPVMLAALMADDAVFLNMHWWKKDWPEDAKKTTALCVNCNDVFAWGCADAEALFHDDITDLFDHWVKDRNWGAAVWCMKKRNQMPQKPVEDAIRKAGIWDIDGLGLPENTMDAQIKEVIYGKVAG